MAYCMYLRKSRKDLEAEMQGAGETLARHRQELLSLAQRCGYEIGHIYTELVSGDTIASRPVMQQLLNDVQDGKWQGVLVHDIARLARGDTMDQGIVSQTFRYSTPPTLIITPERVFDPDNEADEEYFEFNLFFARREYKAITRRMQAGRTASTREGKYAGSVDPYGYERYKLKGEKGWSLRIVPHEAQIVRLIFDLFANGQQITQDGATVHVDLGATKIADILNDMGVRTKRGNPWTTSAIRTLVHNPIYSGHVQWYRREKKVQMIDGHRVTKRPFSDKHMVVEGRHEAIVSQELWDAAQIASLGRQRAPVHKRQQMINPLSGLVKCSECGHTMVSTPGYGSMAGTIYIKCSTSRCKTSACPLPDVEEMILETLAKKLTEFELKFSSGEFSSQDDSSSMRIAAQARVDELEKRRLRLMDLLEEGTYDTATYTQRMFLLKNDLDAAKAALESLPEHVPSMHERVEDLLPHLRHVVQAYDLSDTAAEKNKLLKTVVERVEYHKTHVCKHGEKAAKFVEIDVVVKV